MTSSVAVSSSTVLKKAITGQARLVVGGALLFMSWQACESLVPVAIGAVLDNAITPHDGRAMLGWIGLLAALFLVLSVSFRFGSRLARQASQLAAHEARVEIAGHVLDQRTEPDPSRRAATVVSIANSDADRIGQFCSVAPRTCGALVSVLVAAIVLLRISVSLGLFVLIGAVVLLVGIHFLGVPLERRSGAEQAHAAEAVGLATDLVNGLRVLKGIGGECAAADRYQAASRRSLHATLRAATSESTYNGSTLLLTLCFVAVVALVGGRLATEGRISVGDLVAAVGLAQFLLGPLYQLSSTGAMLAKARASATRVAAILASPRATGNGGALPDPAPGALTVHTDRLELAVAPGELLGVAADTADAGALVDLLAAAVFHGAVAVDGAQLAELDPEVARGALLVARHDAHLFAESVLDNVRAGRPDGVLVRAAINAADTDQVADTLPDGLDTQLSERGRSLSGGQRQRVALARALSVDPPVLVLHDPTTAVDAATEARIADGLKQLRGGRTTVLVATSPALLRVCDRVLLVVDGAVRAEGRHSDLVDTEPAYRELVLA